MGNVYENQSASIFTYDRYSKTPQKKEKRTKLEIYYDLLCILYEEMNFNGINKPSLIRIASLANLPYIRFKETLAHLSKQGLIIHNYDNIFVTEKGVEFLREYQRFNNFLKQIGIQK